MGFRLLPPSSQFWGQFTYLCINLATVYSPITDDIEIDQLH